LHTDQKHPHVHLVVKAEAVRGRRLHIDKQLLRVWREDFARLMSEHGIAANAMPAIRGDTKTNPGTRFSKRSDTGDWPPRNSTADSIALILQKHKKPAFYAGLVEVLGFSNVIG
jgi:hypothetical protein